MANKARTIYAHPQPRVAKSSTTKNRWLSHSLTAFFSVLFGALIAYAALQPTLSRSAALLKSNAFLSRQAANEAFDHQQWQDAVRLYQQAIANGENDADLHTDLGTAYRMLHDPSSALQQYSMAQSEDPNHENSLLNEGIVYAFDVHDVRRATDLFQTYLQRFPHGVHAVDASRMLDLLQPKTIGRTAAAPSSTP